MGFCKETERKARKQHKCNLCHKTIEVGEKYIVHVDNMYDETVVVSAKECLDCQPVKDEYLNWARKNDVYQEGYCDEILQTWWIEEKCPKCANYHPACKPDNTCPGNCSDRKSGRCTADYCDDMTHYCRCEKFEVTKDG